MKNKYIFLIKSKSLFCFLLGVFCCITAWGYDIHNVFNFVTPEYKITSHIPIDIHGVVTDAFSGNPLPGVTVAVKGTTKGTITNSKGQFKLDEVPDNAILVFSFIGYQTQQTRVNGRSVINIQLKGAQTALNQLVVIGYGSQKKEDLTGSVASVGSKDFSKGIVTNALQLLEGKVAGVNVSETDAEPGSSINIRIRGIGSINGSNSALIVVDGVPVSNTTNINPSNIKSIEILKDASAAAIYGTRAANGVVLITTKNGGEGPAKVSYNTYWSYQTPESRVHALNAAEYMHYQNYINEALGNPLPFSNEQIAQAGKGTDWIGELLRDSWATNQVLSVSGGNEKVKYYASLRYLNQAGILINSGFQQYNGSISLEITPNNKFKFGIKLNDNIALKDKIRNSGRTGFQTYDPLESATQFDPTLPTGKDSSGEYYRNPTITLDNPIAVAYGYHNHIQDQEMYGNIYGEYEFIKGLKVTLRAGSNILNSKNNAYKDRTTWLGAGSGGVADVTNSHQTYWLTEGLINYEKTFGQHHLSLMGGISAEKFINTSLTGHATGFLSDVTLTNFLQSADANSMRLKSNKSSHTLQSYFLRANYSFKNEYLLTATIRRDGTSRFSQENKYAYFPSLALAWKVTQEPFMKNIKALSNLKLRVSYGQMGSEGIGNYETINTYVAGGNAVLGGQLVNGAQSARLVNENLKWETTEEYNFGLDFGLMENSISGSLEYYIKNTINQLFNKPVPASTGFSSIRTNFGTVRNSGFEFSVTSQNITGKGFNWTTQLNFSTLKNKVIELPPFIGQIILGTHLVANIPGFSIVKENYPISSFYGYKIIGIFQKDDDIKDSPQPDAKPGWPKFLDRDNDGKITANDRVILGQPFPKFNFGFRNTFFYKNFSLNIYLMGVQGIDTYNGTVLNSIFPRNSERNIISKFYFNRWTPDNPNNEYPSLVNPGVYFGNGKMINNLSIQNASYIRLKNIRLTYNVPLNNQKIFKSLDFFISGENLFIITKFTGYNPGGNLNNSTTYKSNINDYPIPKEFTIGANVTF